MGWGGTGDGCCNNPVTRPGESSTHHTPSLVPAPSTFLVGLNVVQCSCTGLNRNPIKSDKPVFDFISKEKTYKTLLLSFPMIFIHSSIYFYFIEFLVMKDFHRMKRLKIHSIYFRILQGNGRVRFAKVKNNIWMRSFVTVLNNHFIQVDS